MDTTKKYNEAEEVARDYYNSRDADVFYHKIWGGTDIHTGRYFPGMDDPFVRDTLDASIQSKEEFLDELQLILSSNNIKPEVCIDLGAGYCGGAMEMANRYEKSKVLALNISAVEIARSKVRLGDSYPNIEHVEGSYEDIPLPDESVDCAFSMDAFTHSGDRAKLMREIFRVLKPGGVLMFSDLMAVDGVDQEELKPILERIKLKELGTLDNYTKFATDAGFTPIFRQADAYSLTHHYHRVYMETVRREAELLQAGVSKEYLTKMKCGLLHWTIGGEKGNLHWGWLGFKKA